jgi:hypothetical protein
VSSTPEGLSGNTSKLKLSLDAWAVAAALLLSLLVWSGVIKHIPW